MHDGKVGIADLVFLSLQLCLASDSRHMSQRDRSDVIRSGTLGSVVGSRSIRAETVGFKTMGRGESL